MYLSSFVHHVWTSTRIKHVVLKNAYLDLVLSTMWTSTRIKHVVLRNAYLDLVLVSTWGCPYQHMIIDNSFNDIFMLIHLNLHTTILMTITTWCHPSWVVWDLPFDASPMKAHLTPTQESHKDHGLVHKHVMDNSYHTMGSLDPSRYILYALCVDHLDLLFVWDLDKPSVSMTIFG